MRVRLSWTEQLHERLGPVKVAEQEGHVWTLERWQKWEACCSDLPDGNAMQHSVGRQLAGCDPIDGCGTDLVRGSEHRDAERWLTIQHERPT
jgi:hypothetical protein